MILQRLSYRAIRDSIETGVGDNGLPELLELRAILLTVEPDGEALSTETATVEATAEQWHAFADWLYAASLTSHGETNHHRNRNARMHKLEKRIRAQLTKLAGHPAYRGLAIMGVDRTKLPAVRFNDGNGNLYPLFPCRRFMLNKIPRVDIPIEEGWLFPETVRVRGRDVTRWTFHPGIDSRTVEPNSYPGPRNLPAGEDQA
jgi:hypothetical protein